MEDISKKPLHLPVIGRLTIFEFLMLSVLFPKVWPSFVWYGYTPSIRNNFESKRCWAEAYQSHYVWGELGELEFFPLLNKLASCLSHLYLGVFCDEFLILKGLSKRFQCVLTLLAWRCHWSFAWCCKVKKRKIILESKTFLRNNWR